jgi:hypothetical protein
MDILGPEAVLRIVRNISRREGRPAIAGQFPMAIEVLYVVVLLSVSIWMDIAMSLVQTDA